MTCNTSEVDDIFIRDRVSRLCIDVFSVFGTARSGQATSNSTAKSQLPSVFSVVSRNKGGSTVVFVVDSLYFAAMAMIMTTTLIVFYCCSFFVMVVVMMMMMMMMMMMTTTFNNVSVCGCTRT